MNADFKHPKLTELAFCAGCAAKLRAEVLVDIINLHRRITRIY